MVGEIDAESGDEVHFRQGIGDLVAVAFRHATGDDETGAGTAQVRQFQHGVDGLLTSRLNKGTGVDDDEVSLRGIRGPAIPLTRQTTLQLVRIHLVLGAPQSLQPVPTLDHTFSSQPAGTTTVAAHGAPTVADLVVRALRVPDPRAEREGFEPSDPVTQVNSLAVNPIRPLSHLSRGASLGHPGTRHSCSWWLRARVDAVV